MSTRRCCRSVAFSLSLAFLGAAASSQAQDMAPPVEPAPPPAEPDAGAPEPAAPPLPPVLEPPEATSLVEAPYPPDALAAKLEGVVGLRILVDAEGRVTEAEVVEPIGHGFDEAAREAVRASTFRPARRDGVNIPARILFRYTFKLPPPPPPVVEPVPAPLLPVESAKEAVTPTEVRVRTRPSETTLIQNSAEAVTVVDLKQARKRASDLGEVMSRTQGVSIRRSGGLGSEARFSLNGLANDQIRFFVDGIPVETSPFPFVIANVPVNLINRIDVYRGVVPLRLSVDALGGAVNEIPLKWEETGASVSYQISSFHTHRVTLAGGYRHEPSGFLVSLEGYYDYTKNDYEVDVEVPDERGRLYDATVKRFHDGYTAHGVTLRAGFLERPWAKRLMLTAFTTGYDKELQHNVVMTVPYGEVEYGERVTGTNLQFEQDFTDKLSLEVDGAYSYGSIDFEDKGKWIYNWFGDKVDERRVPGEISGRAVDQTVWQHTAFARALATYQFFPGHFLRASVSPQYFTRTGDERIQADPSERDPLTAERRLMKVISGLEYESNFWPKKNAPSDRKLRDAASDYRLMNALIFKVYNYRVWSEEPLIGGIFREKDQAQDSVGIGDSVRLSITDWALVKVSYEWARRLPDPSEVFGDGILIQNNLNLEPETTHNVNVGPRFDVERPWLGHLVIDINGVLRETDKMITLLGNDQNFTYQNVYDARTLGAEGMMTWTSPKEYAQLDGSVTYTDRRNRSNKSTFAMYEGDRIPNNPFLNASWGAGARLSKLGLKDELETYYQGRYVKEYYRGWESAGNPRYKQTVPTQVSHTVGVQYGLIYTPNVLRMIFEVQNVSDAKLYDFIGVQRPGRAYFFKITGEI